MVSVPAFFFFHYPRRMTETVRSRGAAAATAFFMASLLTATFIGSKLTTVFGFTFSVGLLVFPFTFVALETATEVYGRAFAGHLIRTGIFIQLYVLFLVWIGGAMPESPLRPIGEAYGTMFGLAPRMILASITAYTASQFLDVSVFLRLREATHGRHLWLRANAASYLSQAVDTMIFSVVFLGGVLPWDVLFRSMTIAYLVKIIVGTFDTPFVYLGRRLLLRLDRGAGAAAPDPSEDFRVVPFRTEVFSAGQDLVDFVVRSVPKERVREGMILAITSKIVSLAEGELVTRAAVEKGALIRREADTFLGETLYGVALTIKHGILIPSAGIDESNSADGSFILFPKDPYASARRLHAALRERWDVKDLGILITDSHTQPLRKGVTGIGLSHWGFRATRNLVGTADLFGREMKMTHVNVLDALAVAAVYAMGEVAERRPLAIVYGSGAEFTETTARAEIEIPVEEDLYGHLLFKASEKS
jgi:uncharacterized integral membrane protein (TIGR00697 family)